jgi:hypothetical protein
MDDPGLKNLGDAALAAINAAVAATVITMAPDSQGHTQAWLALPYGTLSATLQANFTYGAGGDTLKVIVETSLDQGTSWIEVARLAFALASLERVVNLSALTPVAVYTPVALADDAVKDGILGPRWRARILKGAGAAYTGNTSLSLRLVAR